MSSQGSGSGQAPSPGMGAAEGAAGGAAAGTMVLPGWGTAIGAVAGAGLGVAGALISAHDQAELDAKKADIARKRAAEINDREVANEDLRDQQAYRAKLSFGAAFAGAGKAGTGIGSQLEIQRQTDLQNMISNRDAQFQEQMLISQASIDSALGQETSQAGTLSAAATAIGGATQAYGALSKPSSPGTQQFGQQPGV